MAKAKNEEVETVGAATEPAPKKVYSKEFIANGATFTGHPYKAFEMLLMQGKVTPGTIENIIKFTGVRP